MSSYKHFDYLFNPRSVALIGASNTIGKWGYGILSVLISKGWKEIYPVNHKEAEVLGIKAYGSILEVPVPVDLAVITVPIEQIVETMRDCVKKGVKSALVITGGLSETSEEGAMVEQEMLAVAREEGLRFIGPNCMGHLNTRSNLFTTPAELPVMKGPVSVISQSGNASAAIIDVAWQMGLGINKWVGSGNEADLHFEDYLQYLAEDKETKVIIGYIEGFREGRRFFELAKKISRKKPIVIMKAGRTDAGARAARSHSASLAGEDVICETAFKQSGVIRAEDINELIDVALTLVGQPLPRGKRVGVLSLGGGFGVITADAARRQGLEIPLLSATTMEKLNALLSGRWSHGNPIDPGGDMITYPCLWPLLADKNVDSVVVLSNFGASDRLPGTFSTANANVQRDEIDKIMAAVEEKEIKEIDTAMELMKQYHKPIIFANMFPVTDKGDARKKLRSNYLTPFPTPERAVRALALLVEYSKYLRTSREG
ncbi:acetate--CoA ligase family protein [Chloroflexota bacterium]